MTSVNVTYSNRIKKLIMFYSNSHYRSQTENSGSVSWDDHSNFITMFSKRNSNTSSIRMCTVWGQIALPWLMAWAAPLAIYSNKLLLSGSEFCGTVGGLGDHKIKQDKLGTEWQIAHDLICQILKPWSHRSKEQNCGFERLREVEAGWVDRY